METDYWKVNLQMIPPSELIIYYLTFSENSMSALPSDNPEDANSRSFWMVRVYYACGSVCFLVWILMGAWDTQDKVSRALSSLSDVPVKTD